MGLAGVSRLSELIEELMRAASSVGSHDLAATVPTGTSTPPSSVEAPRTQPLDTPVGRAGAQTVPLAGAIPAQGDGVDPGAATGRGGRSDRKNTLVLPVPPIPAADSPAPAERFGDTQASPAPSANKLRRPKTVLYWVFGSATAVAAIAGVLYRPMTPVATPRHPEAPASMASTVTPAVAPARTTVTVAPTVAARAPTVSAGALTQRFSDRLAFFHREGVAAGMRDGKAAVPKTPPAKAGAAGKTPAITKAPAGRASPPGATPDAASRPIPTVDHDPEVVYIEAVKLIKAEDFEGAIATLNRCVQIDPRYGECFRALGIAYARVGNKSWAARYYRKYLQVMPDASDAEKVKEILAAFESKN